MLTHTQFDWEFTTSPEESSWLASSWVRPLPAPRARALTALGARSLTVADSHMSNPPPAVLHAPTL